MKKEDYLIQKFEHANRIVKIYFDPEPFDPRDDENTAILACWHPRYNLGDKKIEPCSSDDLIQEHNEKDDPILAILPLYLIDHSGLSIRTTPFSCSWDSGQVGWGYITRSKADAMGWSSTDATVDWEDVIKSEVETYDCVMTNQVYGYEIYGKENDLLDSNYGEYVGEEGLKNCIADAKRQASMSEDPAVEAEAEELQFRITYAAVY